MEAEVSSDSTPEIDLQPTEADACFIDDSIVESQDNALEILKEHHRNVKRIAKNLDEFSDCLDFTHSNMASLKAFILQML